ncbi:sarcosine oxidase subunit gamma [Hahella ganghwensis]|uniref:sarcosine oxidase subunit gamma n=1 Tax=Hahella ganghwensis TaxID=286420 RepID=UPI00036BA8FC|nr:sarcosine oxidase subunit gamma family protein [Hahella ganghwensis]
MSEVLEPTKNEEALIAVMDQNPVQPMPTESPMHHLKLGARSQGSNVPTVYAGELGLKGHLVIRGDADNSDFRKGVEVALGLGLTDTLQSAESDSLSISWLAPDEWLVICPLDEAFAVETALRNSLKGHYSVVNVSGGQTVVRLTGANAVNVLKKSSPYDFHETHFPVGKVVTTLFGKTQAVIRRKDKETWDLVIRRSFADYAWRWLEDAASEYGFQVADNLA